MNNEEVLASSISKQEISLICERFGIKKNNYIERKDDFIQILKEYFKSNLEYSSHINSVFVNVGDYLR